MWLPMVKALLGRREMRSAVAGIATAVAAVRNRVVTGSGAEHSRHRSTPERIRRRLAVVFAATALLWITATIILLGQHRTVQSVSGSASPAYLDVIHLHAALSDADSAAWQSFQPGEAQFAGEVQFAGPRSRYQDDITNASQDIQQLVALSGGAGGQQLQDLSPELVDYQILVEKANAAYTDIALGKQASVLGYAYLTIASHSLRDSGDPLPIVDYLTVLDRRTVEGQLSAPWANPALFLVVALAGFLALGSIIVTQVYLRRRFQRTISLPLVVAAALVCGLMTWMAVVILSADAHFAAARETELTELTQAWNHQICAVDTEALKLSRIGGPSHCAPSIKPSTELHVSQRQDANGTLDDLAEAANTGGLPIGIPALAAAIATFAWLGIRPRLHEYRG